MAAINDWMQTGKIEAKQELHQPNVFEALERPFMVRDLRRVGASSCRCCIP